MFNTKTTIAMFTNEHKSTQASKSKSKHSTLSAKTKSAEKIRKWVSKDDHEVVASSYKLTSLLQKSDVNRFSRSDLSDSRVGVILYNFTNR